MVGLHLEIWFPGSIKLANWPYNPTWFNKDTDQKLIWDIHYIALMEWVGVKQTNFTPVILYQHFKWNCKHHLLTNQRAKYFCKRSQIIFLETGKKKTARANLPYWKKVRPYDAMMSNTLICFTYIIENYEKVRRIYRLPCKSRSNEKNFIKSSVIKKLTTATTEPFIKVIRAEHKTTKHWIYSKPW